MILKLRYLALFFCFCFISGYAFTALPRADECGNKYANLMELFALVHDSGIAGVEVPAPHCLPSSGIESYLMQKAPQIFSTWKELSEQFAPYAGKDNAVEFLTLPETETQLGEINALITEVFAQAARDPEELSELGLDDSLLRWLSDVAGRSGFLMVRSSGHEDSKELANAGGNASVAYVKPELPEVLHASGIVVASYFSAQSLKNRILSHQNPFEQPLKMAVLLQELVGESIGGSEEQSEIPIGVVLFTDEPNYTDSPDFRITRLSGTWGHGEAVVENRGISNDTVLLVSTRQHPDEPLVYYDKRMKMRRLIPKMGAGGSVDLFLQDNPPAMQRATLFSQQMLLRLEKVGRLVEEHYKTPMDMELVIKGDTIFLVQARPVNRPKADPSYFDFSKVLRTSESPLVDQKDTIARVNGKSNALVIKSSDEVLVSQTLVEALKKYSRQQLVIIWKNEPTNSHAIVTFSGMGVPVAFASNRDEIEQMLDKLATEGLWLAVSTQTGRMTLWDPAKDTNIDETIVPGWEEHPAPLAISFDGVDLSFAGQESVEDVDPHLAALIRELKLGDHPLETLEEIRQQAIFSQLVQQQATLMQKYEETGGTSWTARQTLNAYDRFQDTVQAVLVLLKNTYTDPISSRLERLFLAKVLETLLLGPSVDQDATGRVSLGILQRADVQAQAGIDYQADLGMPGSFEELSLLSDFALTPTTASSWKQFLLALDKATKSERLTPEQNTKLKRFDAMMEALKQAQAIPLWMTLFFKVNPNQPWETLDNLLTQYGPDASQDIDKVLQLVQEVNTAVTSESLFADPKAFRGAWNRLEKLSSAFTETSQPDSMINIMKRGSPLVRIVGASAMKQFVDAFDNSIKSLVASTEWDPPQQTQAFKKMVGDFLAVLFVWHAELIPVDSVPMSTNFDLSMISTREEYLQRFQETLDDLPNNDPAQLQITPTFDVSIAFLGSGAIYALSEPNTVADIWTTTHQSLLFALSVINDRLIDKTTLQHIDLPEGVASILDEVGQHFSQQPSLEITPNDMSLIYNVPLRHHAMQARVSYDKITKQTTFTITYKGVSYERWPLIAMIADALSQEGIAPFAAPTDQNTTHITMTWLVDSPKHLQLALAQHELLKQLSMDYEWKDYVKGLSAQITPDQMAAITLRISGAAIERWKEQDVIIRAGSVQQIASGYGALETADQTVRLAVLAFYRYFSPIDNPEYMQNSIQMLGLATDQLVDSSTFDPWGNAKKREQALWIVDMLLDRAGESPVARERALEGVARVIHQLEPRVRNPSALFKEITSYWTALSIQIKNGQDIDVVDALTRAKDRIDNHAKWKDFLIDSLGLRQLLYSAVVYGKKPVESLKLFTYTYDESYGGRSGIPFILPRANAFPIVSPTNQEIGFALLEDQAIEAFIAANRQGEVSGLAWRAIFGPDEAKVRGLHAFTTLVREGYVRDSAVAAYDMTKDSESDPVREAAASLRAQLIKTNPDPDSPSLLDLLDEFFHRWIW